MRRKEAHRAALLGPGQRRLGARLVEIGFGALIVSLIGTRVDDEQHLALLHQGAIGEVD